MQHAPAYIKRAMELFFVTDKPRSWGDWKVIQIWLERALLECWDAECIRTIRKSLQMTISIFRLQIDKQCFLDLTFDKP